ncbi:hypothetical protein NJO91_09880 [Streptomyces microflavus]|uniref:hypothetical protein n=1 Tax=Streptomyces microflavus TaxID=1919 RepID=UPI0029AE5B75|nr:hypothetical protein [Streptomyces microflavus]MDX2403435.1 hypothetical protein [Streptomyces microflavus]
MTIKLVELEVCSRTTAGNLRYSATFGDGLNVLAAPNSFGKSTFLQAVIYALGLEGMFSAGRKPPFGPAMLSVADFPDGTRGRVRESWVTLTVANSHGHVLRSKRFVVSDEIDNFLVQTWQARSYGALHEARRVDMFVRQPGSAARELGFHHELARFIGWNLPMVPGFNSAEVSLYVECLFPLFYVEQKSGWSGVTPRMPTYLRIRDMLRRSVEFILGLSTLDRLRAVAALRAEEDSLRTSWQLCVQRASEAADTMQARLSFLSENPVTPARHQDAVAEVFANGQWVPLQSVIEPWRERLRHLESSTLIPAGQRTDTARAELTTAEGELRKLGASLRLITEQLNLVRNDVDLLASRLASLNAEREKLLDLRKLQRMGSGLEIAAISDDSCPTCGQSLDGREVGTGVAADIDQSLLENEAEKSTLESVRDAASQRLNSLDRDRRAVESLINDSRQRVRHLRDELAGPSASPSKAQVQEQVQLASTIDQGVRILDFIEDANELLREMADKWQDVRDRMRDLGDNAASPEDQAIVARFQQSFREQLADYGLRSIPPNEISIDPETLLPVNDGMELAFDLTMAISASDMIRTKWAYYVALFEAARVSSRGQHAKLLIFDEPRQQETDRGSLSEFVKRLSSGAAAGCQIIYATSEDPRELQQVLQNVPYSMLPASGSHLLAPQ